MDYSQEQWEAWYPLKNLVNSSNNFLEIKKFNVSNNEFSLIMGSPESEDEQITFNFGTNAIAYQYIYEGFRLKTMGWRLTEEYNSNFCENFSNNLVLPTNHNFFKTKSSKLLKEVKANLGQDTKYTLHHYIFFDNNFCMDVISKENPLILKEKSNE